MKITLFILALFALVAVLFFAWTAAIKNAKQSAIRPRRHKGARRHWRAFYLAPLMIDRVAWWFGFSRAPRGGVLFANIAEGTHEHGVKSYIPDAGATSRYLFYEIGSTADNCRIAAGVNEPLGVSEDQADANNLDLPIAIKLLNASKGTQRAISDGTVTNGTRICVLKDGTGRATCPAGGAGTFWMVGRAIIPSDAVVVAGDPFEFIPYQPVSTAY